MAADGFDIRLLGDKELARKFRRLDTASQGKVLRPALRELAKAKLLPRVVANIPVRTGRLKNAFRKTKIRSAGKRGVIRIGPVWPTREELGIAADDPYYWPTALEFGHGNVPARPYMRPAVDNHMDEYRTWLARRIGRGIAKVFSIG